MTAPEDHRDEDAFEQGLISEERNAGAVQPDDPEGGDDVAEGDEAEAEAYEREDEAVPDAVPDEDWAAGPAGGR